MLSSKNIHDDVINFEGARRLNDEEFQAENRRTDVGVGDVLMTIVGTIGRVAEVKIDDLPFVLQRSVGVLKPDFDRLNSKYLTYALKTSRVQRQLARRARGVAQKGVYLKDVKNVTIPLPPLEEQKRIAGILDEADLVRKKTQALIDKYDELAQSLFLDMFGDPVTNPKGWEVKALGSVQEIKSGGTPKRGVSEFYSPKEIPWVKTGDLKPMYLRATTEWISRHGLQSSAAKLFPKNTLLVAMYGATIGASSILDVEASTNQACAALLPCDSYDVTFEYYLFKQLKPRLIALGEGGAQPNISASILKAMKLPLPPIQTQRQFAKCVAEIMQCQKQVATSSSPDDLFNALLQKAFKGELT